MKRAVLVLAPLLFAVSSAQATELLPGTSGTPKTVAPRTFFDGNLDLVDTTGPLSFQLMSRNPKTHKMTVVEDLTYAESVYTDEKSGGLDFVFQVKLNKGSLTSLTGDGFAGFNTDVFQSSGGKGSKATQTASRNKSGDVVDFKFSPGLKTGQNSYDLIVRTNATDYTSSDLSLSMGSHGTISLPVGFAPAVRPFFDPPTPEPASLVLFGGLALGLGGASLRRWRQRKTVIT